MALKTAMIRNILATAYAANATHVALFDTVPTSTPGGELPGVARQPINWSAPANGVMTDDDILFTGLQAGDAVRGFGVYNAVAGGDYLDGAALPEQLYSSPGTYELDLTYTQV